MPQKRMLKLKNSQVIFLVGSQTQGIHGWLDVPLHGKKLRARNRVAKHLGEHLLVVDKERQKLVDEYGEKDKNGNQVLVENTNNVKIADDKKDEFVKKYNALINSDVEIDIPEELNEYYVLTWETLLDLNRPMGIEEGVNYEEVCDALQKAG